MPVKVRCPGCQKVLSAPDAARGKAVKCPACETKIRVPGGDGAETATATATATKPAAARRSGVKKPASEDDFLSGLDSRSLEDRKNRICMKCGAPVGEDDVECPKCFRNLETGLLSELMAKKLARKGPDPNEFYGKAWGDAWKFLMKNKRLALQTGMNWSVFMTLSVTCAAITVWCDNIPPKVFWGGLTLLFSLGIGGWYWFLTGEVIKATLDTRKIKRMDRINFDFMTNVALGVKSQLWPLWLVHTFPPIFLLLPVVFPVAMVHMTRRYTYKSWIGWEMLLISVKNFLPAAYFAIVGFCVFIVPAAVAFGWSILAQIIVAMIAKPVGSWTLGLMDATLESPGFFGWPVLGILCLLAIIFIVFPIGLILAYPAVFMTRVNGLFAYYNHRHLDLVDEQTAGVPCGFWVRYIALWVDTPLLNLVTILVWKNRLASLIGWLINIATFAIVWFAPQFIWTIGVLMTGPYYNWMYNALQEGSGDQSTIGKQALGIVVTDMEGNPISLKHASGRWAGKFYLTQGLTLGLGFLLAAFTPKKQALHDLLSKTMVVWKGDDETAR